MFLAGVAAAAITLPLRDRSATDKPETDDLKRSLADLESRLNARASAHDTRLDQVDTRLDEHEMRLKDVPSTTQIVAAMEQLLVKTMSSLDERLTTQANSIDVLKATVSQTDGLLERVLESLDSLHDYNDPTHPAQNPTLKR
jgi:chromosome segregation ATPase